MNLNTSIENDLLILYKVSLSGDVAALEALLQEDELILDSFSLTCFHETPLHIAAMRGHLHFTKALVSRKPKLADDLDSLCRLPLHLASAEGYLDIVQELLHLSPKACSARDQDGRIPLHLAVMKGRIDVMKELITTCPESISEKLDHGETILHLYVKHNRFEALKLLVETARDDKFVNASDDHGNTILHLSSIYKQVESGGEGCRIFFIGELLHNQVVLQPRPLAPYLITKSSPTHTYSMMNLNTSIENDQLILYKVSLSGDVAALEALLQEDELILDRVSLTCFHETPLHIAAMRGHLHFTKALVSRKPKLADDLDSLCRLPLHLASAEGYLDIVQELLHLSPKACSARDQDGRIPLHLAVMKGRIDVVKELITTCPESISEKLDHGETILHLCVKHNRFEALKLLVETTRDDKFVNDSDDHGNTILHLSSIYKQVETTKYLILETSIKTEANALNGNGFTALDAVEHTPRDSKGLEIQIILLEAGVHRNKGLKLGNLPSSEAVAPKAGKFKVLDNYIKHVGMRLQEARGNILVAATVTASLSYQAGINPPESKADHNSTLPAAPPQQNTYAIYTDFGDLQGSFWFYNSVSLMLSLLLIMMMLSVIPLKNKLSTIFLVLVMCFTVVYISQAYFCAAVMNFSNNGKWDNMAGISLVIASTLVPLLFYSIILIHVAVLLIYLGRFGNIWFGRFGNVSPSSNSVL